MPIGVPVVCKTESAARKLALVQAIGRPCGITPFTSANRSRFEVLWSAEVEPLQGVLDSLSLPRYLEGVVPKGVAVRIRARAFDSGAHRRAPPTC